MKTSFACLLLLFVVSTHPLLAQQKTTPSPFPGWANKTSPAPGGAGARDNADFLGEWEGFIATGDGSNPNQRAGNITLSITKEKIVAGGGGGTNGEGTYKISGGSGKYRKIDSSGTEGQYRGKQYEGIFTVEGNTLKWCSGNPGKGRPSDLKTNVGSGFFLMVLTRKN